MAERVQERNLRHISVFILGGPIERNHSKCKLSIEYLSKRALQRSGRPSDTLGSSKNPERRLLGGPQGI